MLKNVYVENVADDQWVAVRNQEGHTTHIDRYLVEYPEDI